MTEKAPEMNIDESKRVGWWREEGSTASVREHVLYCHWIDTPLSQPSVEDSSDFLLMPEIYKAEAGCNMDGTQHGLILRQS